MRCFQSLHTKKGAGRKILRPAYSSRFALSDNLLLVTQNISASSRQNLAAACATAGQNLTAVGSSHSLAETVDLGTLTIAGLIGTLHLDTPPKITIMLDSRERPQQHIFFDHNWSC